MIWRWAIQGLAGLVGIMLASEATSERMTDEQSKLLGEKIEQLRQIHERQSRTPPSG